MCEVIFSMIIWGCLGAFVLWSKLSMINIAFSRCIIGGFFLLLYCFYKGYLNIKLIPKKEFFLVALSGIFLITNWYLLFESFRLSSITIGNVSYYLQPIFLVILAIYFFHEKISLKKWLFIFLSFLGVILITGFFHTTGYVEKNMLLGVACAVLAGLLYAFVSVMTKNIHKIPVSMITLIQLFSGAIFILPWIHFSDFQNISKISIGCILIIGIVHTALAYILYYNGMKKTSFSVISVLSYVDPIVAVLTDIIFFNQHLSVLQIGGVLITLISSYLVIRLPSDNTYKKCEDVKLCL